MSSTASWAFRHRGALTAATVIVVPFISFVVADGLHLGLAGASVPRSVAIGGDASLAQKLPWLVVPFLLVLTGGALRTWATAYLTGTVMRDPDLRTERLLIVGPYRHLRDPLYLGNILLFTGFGLVLPYPGLFLSFGLTLGLVLMLARDEERAMAARYGAEYADYRASVRSLLPRVRPFVANRADKVGPNWRNGARAEAPMVLLFLGLVLAALSIPVGLAIAAAGVLVRRRGAMTR